VRILPDVSSVEHQTSEAGRPRWRAWLREAAIMAAIAGAVLAVMGATRGGGARAIAVADEAPPFDLARADGGERLRSSALAGRPIVLTFWATWCPGCRDELPELEALHRRASDDITIIAVSREPARTVLGYAEKRGMTLPLYIDDAVFARYGIESIPTTIVIGPDGRIRGELTGYEDADALEALARGR